MHSWSRVRVPELPRKQRALSLSRAVRELRMSLLAFTPGRSLRLCKERAPLCFPKWEWSALRHGRGLTSILLYF